MKLRLAAFATCFFLSISSFTTALCQQTLVERLRQGISSAASDSAKLKALLRLCAQWPSINPDTVKKYNDEARELAFLQNAREAIWLTDFYEAIYQFRKNGPDSAYEKTLAAEQYYQRHHAYDSMYVSLYRLKVNIWLKKMKTEEISIASFNLLEMAVAANDPKGQIAANMGLGSTQLKIENAVDALKWYKKALAMVTTPSLKREFNVLYGNIAVAFYVLWAEGEELYKDSVAAYNKYHVEYARESGNATELADALVMQSNMIGETGNAAVAEASLKEALAIRKKIGDTYYALSDYYALAWFYRSNKEYEKASDVLQEGLRLVAGYGSPWSTVYGLYEELGKTYKATGNYEEYSSILSALVKMNDSAYRANSLQAMAEMEAKYSLQTKENTIIKQRLEIVDRERLVAGSICLMLIGGGLAYWAFYCYRRKKKRQLIAVEDSGRQQAEIAVRHAEESQRKRIAAELHDNIGAQISYITSNIDWIVDSPNPLGQAEQTERLKNVHQTSVDVMRNLRETLWALNREEIALDEFSDKLKSYIQTILRLKPGISFSSKEELRGHTILGPLEALNMFRIMQEAANNVLKHSGATTLHLMVSEAGGGQFEISLQDNGTGFDQHAFYEGHYGLKNMRYRANEVGINIKIDSGLGKGSRITVSRHHEL